MNYNAYNAHIRTLGHHAEAKIGQRSLTVSAGSEPGRTNTCPVELLLTSLGS